MFSRLADSIRSTGLISGRALRRGLAFVIVAMVVGLLFTSASWKAQSTLKSNQEWIAEHGVRSNAVGAPDLFREMIDAGVARFDLRQFRIDLPPADCADRLRVSRNDPRCTGAPKDLERLSQRLHQTAAGRAIRDEVARWNEAFDVVAVRDDRARGQACTGQLDDVAARLSAFVLPRGCRPAQWNAYLAMVPLAGDTVASDAGRIDISHRRAAEPAPHVFGFLAADRAPELGDWMAIDAQRLQGATLELETIAAPVVPGPSARGRTPVIRPLRIDVIGDVRAVTIDGVRTPFVSVPADRSVGRARAPRGGTAAGPLDTGGARGLTREQLCLDAGRLRTPRCTPTLIRNGSPFATRLTITGAGRAGAARRIVIEAVPVRSISGRLRQALGGTFCGFRRPNTDDADSSTAIPERASFATTQSGCAPRDGYGLGLRQRITDSLVFWCQGPAEGEIVRLGREAQCFVYFETIERTSQPSEPNLTIKAADGTVLAETVRDGADNRPRVAIKPEAIDLGLLPVVGIGDGDYLSLVGQLAAKSRTSGPLDVSLTIDPVLQRIVKAEVETQLVQAAGQRTEVPVGGLLDGRRRAAIVIMDMDQSPGDILAIATWPSLGRAERLSDWDLRALEAWNPPDSPLAALGWSQNNFLTVPGSSFKPITALAAIQKAIDGDAAIRQALIGYTSEADLQRGMGLTFGQQSYQPSPPNALAIRNFAGRGDPGRVGQAFIAPARTGCPAVGGGAQIGLCEALLKSNNVWFARLAVMMDADALIASPRGRRALTTNLASVVTRLYPASPFPLGEIKDVRLAGGSRAHATPVALDSIVVPLRRQLNPRITLAFNGIGQQVQTTPTAIATFYAGIGSGRIVRPRIIAGPAPQPGDLILRNVDEARQEQWLRYLRQGMKAVVSSPEGTAVVAFRNSGDLHPFLYAKTGTATVQDGDDRRAVASTLGHTVWFAGYFDPRAGQGARGAAPINRRFAFACMVTHARGGTGGALCAPAIERVLRRMAGGNPVRAVPQPVPQRRRATR